VKPLSRRVWLLRSLERPGFTILLVLGLVLGLLQRRSLPGGTAQIWSTIALLAWAIAVVAVNDVADEAIDRVNLIDDPRRVLVRGLASRRELTLISLGAAVVATLTALLAGGPPAAAVILVGCALAAAYSLRPLRLSDRGALTSIVLPIGYVCVPFGIGVTAGGVDLTSQGVLLLSGLAVAAIGRLSLKDFRDVDGDRLFGKRTLLVRYGRSRVCGVAIACVVIGGALAGVAVRSDATGVVDAALLAAITIALLLQLRRGWRALDELLVSDIALLGRGQLLVVAISLEVLHHRIGAWMGALASTGAILVSLLAAGVCHSRRRYVPMSPVPARPKIETGVVPSSSGTSAAGRATSGRSPNRP
jgi:4-hydroxybenzoate polyprenyltransferase